VQSDFDLSEKATERSAFSAVLMRKERKAKKHEGGEAHTKIQVNTRVERGKDSRRTNFRTTSDREAKKKERKREEL